MNKEQITVTSIAPCPFCGGHKWAAYDDSGDPCYKDGIDITEAYIDAENEWLGADECLKCGATTGIVYGFGNE